jgi:hypothetical protein
MRVNEVLEIDSTVSWYVEVLFFNIFKVPDPLMACPNASAEAEAAIKFDLLAFMVGADLAENSGEVRGRQQIVATRKLRRNSDWLISGAEPSGKTDRYMWRLTRRAVRFLASQTASKELKSAGKKSHQQYPIDRSTRSLSRQSFAPPSTTIGGANLVK